jgi:hypothetical protein
MDAALLLLLQDHHQQQLQIHSLLLPFGDSQQQWRWRAPPMTRASSCSCGFPINCICLTWRILQSVTARTVSPSDSLKYIFQAFLLARNGNWWRDALHKIQAYTTQRAQRRTNMLAHMRRAARRAALIHSRTSTVCVGNASQTPSSAAAASSRALASMLTTQRAISGRVAAVRAFSTDGSAPTPAPVDAIEENRFLELADTALHDIMSWLDGVEEMLEESDISLSVRVHWDGVCCMHRRAHMVLWNMMYICVSTARRPED